MRIIIEIDDKQVASYSDREGTARVLTRDTPTEESMLPAIDGGAAAPLDEVQTDEEGEMGSYDTAAPVGESGSIEDAGAAPEA